VYVNDVDNPWDRASTERRTRIRGVEMVVIVGLIVVLVALTSTLIALTSAAGTHDSFVVPRR
jgi:hypothetical protein